MTKRNRQRHPRIGGVVNSGRVDTTKQGRLRAAKRATAEMRKVARKQFTLPTGKEVQDVSRTKEK